MSRLVLNHETYEAVFGNVVPTARKFLWILTADIKDVFVQGEGKRFVPFLQVLAAKLRKGVEGAADPCEGAGAALPGGLR